MTNLDSSMYEDVGIGSAHSAKIKKSGIDLRERLITFVQVLIK